MVTVSGIIIDTVNNKIIENITSLSPFGVGTGVLSFPLLHL